MVRTLFSLKAAAIGIGLFLPLIALAAPVIRTGESVSLKEDQAIDGDFYALGGTITTSAEVKGDAYMAAGAVTANGPVKADLVVAAGSVNVHTQVTDDVRIISGQAVIADVVGGDVAVLAGDVTILSTAEIKGDVLFYGGTLDIKGPVRGSVYARGTHVLVDAAIGGDMTLNVGAGIELGSHADIAGDIVYSSPGELSRALESVVVGEIIRSGENTPVDGGRFRPNILPYLAMLFSAFVLRFIFGTKIDELLDQTGRTFGINGLIGFGLAIILPLAAILMFISIIGTLIGVILLALYTALLAVSWSLAAVLVGAEVARYWKKKPEYGVLFTSLGALILCIVSLVPVVGNIIALAAALVVFGGIAMQIYSRIR